MRSGAIRKNQTEIAQDLAAIAPFRGLGRDELMKIAGSFRRCSYPLGATLVEQNHSVKLLGFIKSGSARRVAQGENDKEFICGSLGRGEFFGAGAALINENAFVGVQCREPTVCYVQAKDDFRRMVKTFPQIRDFFYQNALNQLRDVYRVMSSYKFNGNGLAFTNDDSKKRPRIVKKALDYIDKNYMTPLTLDEVAKVNGMSRYHFSRVFKDKTGRSFKEYLNKVRIEMAKKLMGEQEMNVSEACFTVGFNDLSYFSRVFHNLEGTTPSSYRKKFAETG